jgi:hypothetical protein
MISEVSFASASMARKLRGRSSIRSPFRIGPLGPEMTLIGDFR